MLCVTLNCLTSEKYVVSAVAPSCTYRAPPRRHIVTLSRLGGGATKNFREGKVTGQRTQVTIAITDGVLWYKTMLRAERSRRNVFFVGFFGFFFGFSPNCDISRKRSQKRLSHKFVRDKLHTCRHVGLRHLYCRQMISKYVWLVI